MTQISRPWTGTVTGDAGPYSADNWAQVWRNAFGNGAADADSGPILGSGVAPDLGLTTTAVGVPNASVNVSAGAALVHGTFYLNDATVNLAIAANLAANPRIDTIVLRKSWAAQTVRLAVLQGTAGASPVAPTLTQTDGVTWEIPLADIAVAAGFVSITNAVITPRRSWANVSDGVYLCDILNNSGAIRVAGDVVIIDTTATRAAKLTSTGNDPLVLGVWMARTPIAGYGRVIRTGIGYVNISAAVNRGDSISVSATSGKADVIPASPATGSDYQKIGIALETTSGAGLALCLIDIVPPRPAKASRSLVVDNNASYSTTSATFVDIDPVALSITLTFTGSKALISFAAVYNSSATAPGFDLLIDGVRVGAASTTGIGGGVQGAAFVSFTYLATGLSAGSHTFKIQYRTNGAVALTVYSGAGGALTDWLPTFSVTEID
jgi:hypothetical protein